MIVYLAGPMTGCSEAAMSQWRDDVQHRLSADFTILSPLRGNMVNGDRAEFYRDWWDINKADLLLVYLGQSTCVSIGTVCEMMLAKALGKYVVAVLDSRHDHLFTRECTSYRAPTLSVALEHIRTSFGGKS